MKRRFFAGFLLLFAITFISCQKNNDGNERNLATDLKSSLAELTGIEAANTTTGTEHGVSTELFLKNSLAYVISGENIGSYGLADWHFGEADHLRFGVPHVDSCVIVSVSSSAFPREIVIEYIKGCSAHRHDKSGKIIINLSDTITNEGAIQTIVYQDFYIDTIKVDMSASLKNLGKNSEGNWVIEKTYEQTITSNEDIAVRNNTETQEWIAGFDTSEKSDNIYYLTGSGSITLNDTIKYSRIITTPLLNDASCRFITEGVIELTRNGNVSIIDYGDGTCDDTATITTDGTTEEINLNSHRFRKGGRFDSESPGFGERPGDGGHGH